MVARRNFIKAGYLANLFSVFNVFPFLLKLSDSHSQANNFTLLFTILFYYIYLHQILDGHFSSVVALCVCVYVLLLLLFFFCYESYSRVVVGHLETNSNNFSLKNDARFLCTLWVTAFKPSITFAKTFILDLTGFHALVLVVSGSSYEI